MTARTPSDPLVGLAELLRCLRGRGGNGRRHTRPPELDWFFASGGVRFTLPSPHREPFRVVVGGVLPPGIRQHSAVEHAVEHAEELLTLGIPAVLIPGTPGTTVIAPVYVSGTRPSFAARCVAAGGLSARRAVLAAYAVSRAAGDAARDALMAGD